jgi:curved DNA-binding protein CbpA
VGKLNEHHFFLLDSQYPLIKEAFDVVGNPQNRAKYDRWRQSGLCIPFEDYIQLSGHAQVKRQKHITKKCRLTIQFLYIIVDNPLASTSNTT